MGIFLNNMKIDFYVAKKDIVNILIVAILGQNLNAIFLTVFFKLILGYS